MSQVRFDSSKAARGGGASSATSDRTPNDQAPIDLPADRQSARMDDETNLSHRQNQNMQQPQGQGNAQVHKIGKALTPPDAAGAQAPDLLPDAAGAQAPDLLPDAAGTQAPDLPSDAANDQGANETLTDRDPVAALTDRVEQLEKHNRWMRAITSVVGVCAALVLGGWLYSDGVVVNKTIMESEELKLLDSSGNPRLFLRMYSRVPVLQLVDSDGMPRMSLGLRFDDTPFIDLSDKAGRTRATLEMTAEDAPALRLFNENGGTKFQIN